MPSFFASTPVLCELGIHVKVDAWASSGSIASAADSEAGVEVEAMLDAALFVDDVAVTVFKQQLKRALKASILRKSSAEAKGIRRNCEFNAVPFLQYQFGTPTINT